MEKELLIVLERIATALEKIADSLNKNPAEKPIFVRKSNVKEVGKTDNIVNNYRIIEEFLNSRNIKIKNIPPEEEVDKILDKIAVYMGNNFSLIRSFYELIKHNINSGLTVKLELKNKRQEEINAICNLAKRLHEIEGQGIYAYVTVKAGINPNDDLKKELIELVAEKIGKIAKPDVIHWAPGLPKTRSGKIMRRILRKIAEGEFNNLGDITTLADPSVVQTLIEDKKRFHS